MKARVIELYSAGTRRHSSELRADPGKIGELELDAWETQRPDRPLQMRARLTVSDGGTRRDAFLPIYDVVLLKVTRKGMLLHGIENVVHGRAIAGYVQEWWCEPLGPPAEEPPPKEPAGDTTLRHGIRIT